MDAPLHECLLGVCHKLPLTLEGWLLPERPEPLHGRHGQVPVGRVGQLHLGRGEQLATLQHLPGQN